MIRSVATLITALVIAASALATTFCTDQATFIAAAEGPVTLESFESLPATSWSTNTPISGQGGQSAAELPLEVSHV